MSENWENNNKELCTWEYWWQAWVQCPEIKSWRAWIEWGKGNGYWESFPGLQHILSGDKPAALYIVSPWYPQGICSRNPRPDQGFQHPCYWNPWLLESIGMPQRLKSRIHGWSNLQTLSLRISRTHCTRKKNSCTKSPNRKLCSHWGKPHVPCACPALGARCPSCAIGTPMTGALLFRGNSPVLVHKEGSRPTTLGTTVLERTH